MECNATSIYNYNWHAPRQLLWPLVTIHDKPFVPIQNDSWVGITHCGGSAFEKSDSWFYVFQRSETYLNVGKTIAFHSHDDASLHFLGKRCANRRNTDHLRRPQCNEEIHLFTATALKKGYTSIQFIKHCDARCLGCAHEIVIVGVSGSSHCPLLNYRDSLNRPCVCHKLHTSRRSFSCGSCHSKVLHKSNSSFHVI